MDQSELDRQIKIARVDYDIAAYQAKIIDEKRKKLEAQLSMQKIEDTIADLQQKILGKEAEKQAL